MTRKEIEQQYQQLVKNVVEGKLVFALDILKRLVRFTTRSEYFYEVESISDNYQRLLKYSFEEYHDPKQAEILLSISASILNLADQLTDHLLEDFFPEKRNSIAQLRQEFGSDDAVMSNKIEELFFSHEVSGLIDESLPHASPITENVFKLIWLAKSFRDFHISLIRNLSQNSRIEWHERCLIVSALTISLLNYFDPVKFELLGEFIQKREAQVYHRAMVGFILALICYDPRIRYYPSLVRMLDDLSKEEDIRQDTETIFLQLLMSRETEKITREFEQEVLPDMQKMMPKLGDKLQLDEVVDIDDPEEQNPGWKEMIDEVPGLYEKIEKFSRMQMEGADVFMSTFAMLKRFDFFNQMSHWFLPFYPDHHALKKEEEEEGGIRQRLMDALGRAFYICNSDKYSFALNFQAIPARQRSMIVTHFEAELEQMKDLTSEEELLDPLMVSNSIFTQYIQDLYRFYKLYPHRSEFDDVFRLPIKFESLEFYHRWFEKDQFTEQLASFYFGKEHWNEAIAIFSYLEKKGIVSSQLYQKQGYAFQKKGDYLHAIEAYRKAELFDTDRLWILKKLSFCLIKLQQYVQALEQINQALALQPEDLHLHSQAGQCHFNLKQYDETIRHYSQVRFFSPGNLKALRPIAYCQFILGNLDQASAAYQEILGSAEEPGAYDLMNAGHVALCMGQRGKALGLYRSSVAMKSMTKEIFIQAFQEDTPYLLQQGIRKEELPLIIDYLIIN